MLVGAVEWIHAQRPTVGQHSGERDAKSIPSLLAFQIETAAEPLEKPIDHGNHFVEYVVVELHFHEVYEHLVENVTSVRHDRLPSPRCSRGARFMIGVRSRELEALSLAALVLLAACGAAFAQPSVGGIQVRPNPFSPNGDGFRDSIELFFTPGGATDSVVVTVSVFRDAGNELLGELLS